MTAANPPRHRQPTISSAITSRSRPSASGSCSSCATNADLDYQEIAEAVGIAVGKVGSTLSAAHTALHAALAEEAHDD